MKWLSNAYQKAKDHLTKLLGAAGAALTTFASIDPEPIRQAASFLGQNAAAKVAAILFALVVLRGWYTGKKHAQATSGLPPPVAQ